MDKKTNKDLDNYNAQLRAKKLTPPPKERLRTLKQYASMTEEEFDEFYNKKSMGIELDSAWEKRILQKMDEFAKDYDLDDLKINDKYSLRALASATLRLEDYDIEIGRITSDGINDSNIFLLDKLGKLQTDLRKDIAQLQDLLKISRKIRKSDKEESVINFLEDLKVKAKKFYESKMIYIFCPKCKNLVGTVWLQYPDLRGNKVELHCSREMEDGSSCNTTIQVSLQSLYRAKKSSNNDELMPESLR